MIFDHGVRVFDGHTQARFKAIMDAAPGCSACANGKPGTHIWLNPRTGHAVPMCSDHFSEHEAEVVG